MNPPPSIIAFTTSSGLGYGMLMVLAVGTLSGFIPANSWFFGAVALGLALTAITGGLVASAFHLHHPRRAWLALSQWRSSWLSREGLAALITYLPALAFGMGSVFFETASGILGITAALTALGAAVTVWCTGMIYASLPPIRAWHHVLTAPIYLGFALMTGALVIHFLVALFGFRSDWTGILVLASTTLVFALKTFRWYELKTKPPVTSLETATGLGKFGLVSLLDPPQPQANYVLQEMGFKIGRKHAGSIRKLVYLFGLLGPLAFTAPALVLEGWLVPLTALLAMVSGLLGVLLERWLFFAEADHTVMLYHGGGAEDRAVQTPQATSRSPQTERLQRQRRPASVSMAGRSSR